MTEEDIKVLNAYIESKKNEQKSHKEEHKSRFDALKEERQDWEFYHGETRIAYELCALNDTLALIYDYISEKK